MKLLAPAAEPGVTARSRLSAERVAVAVAALCLVLFGVIHATTDVMVVSLFSVRRWSRPPPVRRRTPHGRLRGRRGGARHRGWLVTAPRGV